MSAKSEREVYNEGWAAHEAGESIEACPYQGETWRTYWRSGWQWSERLMALPPKQDEEGGER